MLGSLAIAAAALTTGLRLRRARRRGRAPRLADRRLHLRLAKTAVVLVGIGFVLGPVSSVWLRGWDAFGTLHAWVALGAALLFAGTGWFGLRVEHGALSLRERHGALAVAALIAAAAALGTGFVLLP
jgi:uncharacterized membrane protein